ncbi:Uncharacterized protein APZ42_000060 [Daphnia magna]|uniref:Uncharacterized protein n=1 Tax=Daphnia magna TaxID=35525 RepID=A0A162CA51_9CRUS|nr:Uncharacterized protein APZ42_000060 [Daphnia magna]
MEMSDPDNEINKNLQSISSPDSIISLNSSCVSQDSQSQSPSGSSCVESLAIINSNESNGELLQSSCLESISICCSGSSKQIVPFLANLAEISNNAVN